MGAENRGGDPTPLPNNLTVIKGQPALPESASYPPESILHQPAPLPVCTESVSPNEPNCLADVDGWDDTNASPKPKPITPSSNVDQLPTQNSIRPDQESARPKKRMRETAFKSKPNLDEPHPAAVNASSSEDTETGKTRLLACPFLKYDGQKHHSCRKYTLRRIKDVKQHIFRLHRRPDFYCPRCFLTFDNEDKRNTHARKTQCALEKEPLFDRISDRQHKALTQYVSRGHTIERQWDEIWDILFPGKPHSSCYLGNDAEAFVSQLRVFWKTRQTEIWSALNESVDEVNRDVFNKVMRTTLDRFESELSNSDADANEKGQRSKTISLRPRLEPVVTKEEDVEETTTIRRDEAVYPRPGNELGCQLPRNELNHQLPGNEMVRQFSGNEMVRQFSGNEMVRQFSGNEMASQLQGNEMVPLAGNEMVYQHSLFQSAVNFDQDAILIDPGFPFQFPDCYQTISLDTSFMGGAFESSLH
ncbi:hypothetical protein B0T10DRAFT_459943 [Thelonectria olida]|uniref:C2H2-type domain-containing protein n=1 Tax=Thelonectria olida TaxID=1576542 RepID=A0A9P9APS1_9HYPO|nr:hypothetical protein B0T10DRAFT_459943 [Thelonectria olida]